MVDLVRKRTQCTSNALAIYIEQHPLDLAIYVQNQQPHLKKLLNKEQQFWQNVIAQILFSQNLQILKVYWFQDL